MRLPALSILVTAPVHLDQESNYDQNNNRRYKRDKSARQNQLKITGKVHVIFLRVVAILRESVRHVN